MKLSKELLNIQKGERVLLVSDNTKLIDYLCNGLLSDEIISEDRNNLSIF